VINDSNGRLEGKKKVNNDNSYVMDNIILAIDNIGA
jgi:hypothetical protein